MKLGLDKININMDLGLGKFDYGIYNKKPKVVYKRPRVTRARQTRTQYLVLTIEGGVTRKHTFSNQLRARAFRERRRAQGTVENISEVVEQRI